jgi:hypothetical protein
LNIAHQNRECSRTILSLIDRNRCDRSATLEKNCFDFERLHFYGLEYAVVMVNVHLAEAAVWKRLSSWEDSFMTRGGKLVSFFSGTVATALLGAAAAAAAPCQGPGAPTTTQTRCVTAVAIPGNPIRTFDISWVDPLRGEYYLSDRSNMGIDIIDTRTLKFKRTIGGFAGVKLNAAGTAVNNNISGPDGVTNHGHWLYAGDGDSTLKVIDLNATANPIQQVISTGGTTRVDEMALTTDGNLLLAANNAEDPPFATLFAANGDRAASNVSKIAKVSVDPAIIPAGQGLSLEQPAWDPTTKRFYTSIPIIADNPPGCVLPNCNGGLLAIDPLHPQTVYGAYDAKSHTGVIALPACSPNGATVGIDDELMLGCTPQNNPVDTQTTIISARTTNSVSVNGITGSDEVYFNAGDRRYYTGSSWAHGNPAVNSGGARLGVVDAETKFFIESIPQSDNSHSVAADPLRNLIFVPQVAPATVVGAGGDGPAGVGMQICGTTTGCIAVYRSGGGEDEQ